ncbi:hypothetical protein A0H81_01740 [Grifola frondosa]|uniref:Uncharacterized protein n=1 Tax=Grifola frondosa TaxID=5627 RepID=A0A1C7ML41_GRIFR|nr:hypothetical protein A0H81_01740 [Grifola frondosa]
MVTDGSTTCDSYTRFREIQRPVGAVKLSDDDGHGCECICSVARAFKFRSCPFYGLIPHLNKILPSRWGNAHWHDLRTTTYARKFKTVNLNETYEHLASGQAVTTCDLKDFVTGLALLHHPPFSFKPVAMFAGYEQLAEV